MTVPEPDFRANILAAVRALSGTNEPRPLIPLACRIADINELEMPQSGLEAILANAKPGDPLATQLGALVAGLDGLHAADFAWTEGTTAFSFERREVVCSKLSLNSAIAKRLSELRPVLALGGKPVVVGASFRRWYSPARVAGNEFYWPSYLEYLRLVRGWPEESLQSLDLATTSVIERLADPLWPDEPAFSARGLVVGHVQSGKTANFTGVIARAIDAGYRFIIVLSGLHEALRRQTQRRLDMDLVGYRNILTDLDEVSAMGRPQGDYLEDPAWIRNEFNRHGSQRPRPGILRLTSHKIDFNKHLHHMLRFKPAGVYSPFYLPENLYNSDVRLAIVKKNSPILQHLVSAIKANAEVMSEVPVLIIDDESDQASVNTAKPEWRSSKTSDSTASETKERKAINRHISKLLKLMPRAQYVGYTATPFANVFVDPDDHHDIFPKDFIIALEQPRGYIGATAFLDEVGPRDPRHSLTNKQAYVRELAATDSDIASQEQEMLNALAAYVVTGAVKLYRQSIDPSLERHFRHHTMLVHEATKRDSHEALAKRIVRIWTEARWREEQGLDILRAAFDDMRPTLEDRAEHTAPFVDSFPMIEPFIDEVLERVETLWSSPAVEASNGVIVVNSDAQAERRLDFDRYSTWKILVGGAMLSRGFTIEGLTITYFRRSPQAHDTLLQMGRWFGYRPGYSDLIRVYLAKNTAISRTQMVNLYDAFVAIAQSEEAFREQLAKYSEWDGDEPAILPIQVPPLVQQRLPWLRPTARDRMYRARIVRQRESVISPKGLPLEPEKVRHNWDQLLPLVSSASEHVEIKPTEANWRNVPAYAGVVPVGDMLMMLRECQWLEAYFEVDLAPKLNFLESLSAEGLLKDFVVLLPQLVAKGDLASIAIPGLGERSIQRRTRDVTGYYTEFTDPAHRRVAEAFADDQGARLPELRGFQSSGGRGVVLAYLIPERGMPDSPNFERPLSDFDPEDCAVGLTIFIPGRIERAAQGAPIIFEVERAG